MGPPAVLVNNAGLVIDKLLLLAKPDDFDKLLSTNLKPVFLLCKIVGKEMTLTKGGRIINMSSVVVHTGNVGQSMYAATKGVVTALSNSAAIEYARSNILVNCVAPGFVETDMTQGIPDASKEALLAQAPLGRMGRVDEIASVVSFLASPAASYSLEQQST